MTKAITETGIIDVVYVGNRPNRVLLVDKQGAPIPIPKNVKRRLFRRVVDGELKHGDSYEFTYLA